VAAWTPVLLRALAGEWDKGHAAHILRLQFTIGGFCELPQGLVSPWRPDGNDHTPAVGQLFGQGRRQMIGSGGDDDGVVGGMVGPPIVAVSLLGVDVIVSQVFQTHLGAFGQVGDDLDGVNLQAGDFRQDGSLIARTGANFQDLFTLFQFE